MASISLRESIRWLPDPASEPTETRVITSPGKRFVDIRILKLDPSSTTTAHVVPPASSRSTIPFSRIEWAFAGNSSHVPDESDPKKKHCQWSHFVDSRSTITDGVVDEGIMTPLPPSENGMERALEVGKMANPATGLETEYEEIWIDVEPKEGGRVLELVDEKQKAKGMVVLAGDICQGVMRKGDDRFDVEVWERKEEDKEKGDMKGWSRSLGYCSKEGAPVGELEFLCETACRMEVETSTVGDKLATSGYDEGALCWHVVEVW